MVLEMFKNDMQDRSKYKQDYWKGKSHKKGEVKWLAEQEWQ